MRSVAYASARVKHRRRWGRLIAFAGAGTPDYVKLSQAGTPTLLVKTSQYDRQTDVQYAGYTQHTLQSE